VPSDAGADGKEEEWSGGVLEEWDRIGEKVLKVRTALPLLSSMALLWRVSALMFSNTPLLHFSTTPSYYTS